MRTLALARDASATENWQDAARLWSEVVAANPVNGIWWYSLAEARDHLDDHAGALDAWTRVFDLGDGLPSRTAVRIAHCHARQGDTASALKWIERGIALGFPDLHDLRDDDAFAKLREDATFRRHAGIPEAGLDRDERWRVDVRFAAGEIRRRAFRPFENIGEVEFDAAVTRIVESVPDLTDHQVILELARLVAHLNDGHARVRVPDDRDDLRQEIPLRLFDFQEGIFVTAAAPDHEHLLGAEVLRIGDRDIAEVTATLDPLIPRDNGNRQWLRACLPDWLVQTSTLHALGVTAQPDRAELTVRDLSGVERTETVMARKPGASTIPWLQLHDRLDAPVPHYLRNASLPFWFEYLGPDRVVYIQFNSVRDTPFETLEAFGDRLYTFIAHHDVDRLVIDMRWNGGGNTLQEWPLLRRIIADAKTNQPGSLFIIVGRGTFSAAQNGVNFLDIHSHATFVGEPTGSSPCFVGETRHFTLPHSRVVMNVGDLHWVGTWPGDKRTWIAPTLYAPPTFAAYRQNRDPALEAILALSERYPAWGIW